jgi:tagaturonate reductase
MNPLPETVLQFGTGKFLRAFADLFIDQANKAGQAVGRVVVAQSTGDNRASLLNRQGGRYHVLVRGLVDGERVDRVEEAESISRALSVSGQWADILAVARAPELRFILSNTAEEGYRLDPADQPGDAPPRSFPARLLLILKERFEASGSGVNVLPCELFERNAEVLLGLVLQLAEAWRLAEGLRDWLRTACAWRNTLVDRIVAVRPPGYTEFADDALLTVTEPFALWAVETPPGTGKLFDHPALLHTPDVRPFFLRKVRILNAAHTALLSQAVPRGLRTVREAILDSQISDWLNRLLFEEILPVLEGRVEDAEAFARQTLERFRNPFIEHKLSDITAYHAAKVTIRLVPTRDEFVAKFGRRPRLLEEAIAWTA